MLFIYFPFSAHERDQSTWCCCLLTLSPFKVKKKTFSFLFSFFVTILCENKKIVHTMSILMQSKHAFFHQIIKKPLHMWMWSEHIYELIENNILFWFYFYNFSAAFFLRSSSKFSNEWFFFIIIMALLWSHKFYKTL